MDVLSLTQYPQASIDNLLTSIPFYKTVKQEDEWQYDILMRHSKIIEYRPGEVVLEKGQKDQWLFFLLKGQLRVLVGNGRDVQVVNHITPGEVFGDLAVLFDHERTATVTSDPNSRKILVFGTDFSIFGRLHDLSLVTLNTKLIYYRNMVHNLRWKLEVYRTSFPHKENSSSHRKIKLYMGPKNTFDELTSLDKQARDLAQLLVEWNSEFDRHAINPTEPMRQDCLAVFD